MTVTDHRADEAVDHPSATDLRRRGPEVVTVIATVMALVAGLRRLGTKSLWYDEAFSVGIVDRPIGDVLWRITHWEVNQSPYYLLFAGWSRISHDPAFLRSLSVAFAVAAVPAMFVLGRRIADARVGAVAATLLALHPFVIQWGQQLRAYSMVVFMVIVATVLLLRAVDHPDRTGPAVLYGMVAAVTIYTQFFAILVVITHLIWAALVRPLPRRVVAAGGAAVGVLVVPLVWYLLTYQGDPLAWVQATGADRILTTARRLAGGRFVNLAAYGVTVAAGLALVGGALLRPRRPGRPAVDRDPDRWRLALPALWLVLPLLVTLATTYTVKPVLEARFVIVVVPALVLLAALAVCRLPWRPVGALLLAVLLVLSVDGILLWQRTAPYEDWRTAVPLAIERAGPDGSLVLDPPLSLFAVRYYRERLDLPEVDVIRPEFDDGPAGPRLVELRRGERELETDLHQIYDSWRDRNYRRIRVDHADGLTITTYERRR